MVSASTRGRDEVADGRRPIATGPVHAGRWSRAPTAHGPGDRSRSRPPGPWKSANAPSAMTVTVDTGIGARTARARRRHRYPLTWPTGLAISCVRGPVLPSRHGPPRRRGASLDGSRTSSRQPGARPESAAPETPLKRVLRTPTIWIVLGTLLVLVVLSFFGSEGGAAERHASPSSEDSARGGRHRHRDHQRTVTRASPATSSTVAPTRPRSRPTTPTSCRTSSRRRAWPSRSSPTAGRTSCSARWSR